MRYLASTVDTVSSDTLHSFSDSGDSPLLSAGLDVNQWSVGNLKNIGTVSVNVGSLTPSGDLTNGTSWVLLASNWDDGDLCNSNEKRFRCLTHYLLKTH